jgi:hypothetical protein
VVGGCALPPTPADPTALNRPLCEPLENGRLVTIEAIYVNGQKAPGKSLERSVERFSQYVAGEVVLVEGASVEIDTGDDGALTHDQLMEALDARKHRGASAITIVFTQAMGFFSDNAYYSGPMGTDGTVKHYIPVYGENVDRMARKLWMYRVKLCGNWSCSMSWITRFRFHRTVRMSGK